MAISVDAQVAELRRRGARDVDQYEGKRKSFGTNEQKVAEFLSEAHAEVKHMNKKQADRAMSAAGPLEFVHVGNVIEVLVAFLHAG